MQINHQQLDELLRMLASTEPVELNCEECLHAVAAYAEIELAGKTPTEALHRVEQHLSVCNDCREEYRALLEAIRGMNECGPY